MREIALTLVLVISLSPTSKARDLSAVIAPTSDFTKPEAYERNPGGATTTRKSPNRDAFSQPSTNLSFEQRTDFFVGNAFFKRLWVTAPASTDSADGLGPLYNARACQRCHLKNGRGHPPEGPNDSAVSMLLRLSIPPQSDLEHRLMTDRQKKLFPEPTYGSQLQDLAIASHAAEGRMVINYKDLPVKLRGGEVVMLRQPSYEITDLGYGTMHPETMLSPRVAPAMIGLGLLESIDAQDILANVDVDDLNGDGISGKPNWVWSYEHDKVMLGRFGWKAGHPTLHQQNSDAMAGDIGISNPLFPGSYGDCTNRQTKCRSGRHGDSDRHGGFETGADVMEMLLFYTRNLAVPARRDIDDPDVLRGKQLFYQTGCTACHRPKFITKRDDSQPAQSFQLIWPYSDLLLHDMGDGLADNRPEGDASGREWRTPPLWGIGLTETVNGHTYFLHDGRARNLQEAILWHDGEGANARKRFADLAKPDREALIAFLNSL